MDFDMALAKLVEQHRDEGWSVIIQSLDEMVTRLEQRQQREIEGSEPEDPPPSMERLTH